MKTDFFSKEEDFISSFKQSLKEKKEIIDLEMISLIPSLGEKNELRDACEYVLTSNGKRFRPSIVLMVANALNNDLNAIDAAISVECFHTASLIADDLPCMDDDDLRRDIEAVHKKFGEAKALLASYGLIALGYQKLSNNYRSMELSSPSKASGKVLSLALDSAAKNTGILGATGGQYLDLFPPSSSLEVAKKIIHKKTTTLFELSFVYGWLFGGGDVEKLPLIIELSAHFGMAFQIMDDFGDIEQDAKKERVVNMPLLMGGALAKELFDQEMKGYFSCLDSLNISTPSLKGLGFILIEKIQPYL